MPKEQLATGQLRSVEFNKPVQSVIAHVFTFTNLAASQTALQGSRSVGQVPIIAPFRGSIVALVLRANANKTAGTATAFAYIESEATAATLTWASATNKTNDAWSEGTIPFAAGEELDVRMTTDSSFTPTTVDVELLLYVTFLPS